MKKTVVSILMFFVTQLLGLVIAAGIVMAFKIIGALKSTDSIADGPLSLAMMYSEDIVPITLSGMLISYVLLMLFFFKKNYVRPADFVAPASGGLKMLAMATVMIVAADFSINMLSSALGLENQLEEEFLRMSSSVWAVFIIGIAGPIIEETVFRRIVIDSLWTSYGRPWLGIVISAVLFGLVHMNPAQSVFAALIGIVYGWMYVRTGSMLPGIIAHVANNTIGVFELRAVLQHPELADEVPFYQDPPMLTLFIVCAVLALVAWRLLGPMPSALRTSRRRKT